MGSLGKKPRLFHFPEDFFPTPQYLKVIPITINTMENFNHDLKTGQEFETSFVNQYKPHYTVTTTQERGMFKGYDVVIQFEDGPVKAELKWDRMAHNTGNHAVELYTKFKSNPNKIINSGLSATESDVYVFGFQGFPEVYAMDTDKLKKMVEDKQHFRVVDYTGDGQATIALFKLDTFLKECELLYTTKPPNAQEN